MFLDKALTAPGAEEYRKIREEEKNLHRAGVTAEEYQKALDEYGKKYGVQPPRGMLASEKAHMILEANYISSVEGDKPAIDADITEVLGALDRADLELVSISGRIKANKEAVESAELSYQGLVAQFDELEETLKTTIRFLEEHPPADYLPEDKKKQYQEDLSSARESLQGLPETRAAAEAQQEEHRKKAAALIAADEDNLTKSGYLLAWRAIELQIAAYIQSKYDCSPLITQTIDRVKELGFTFTPEAEQECKNLSQQWIDRTEALDISGNDFQGPAWETLLSSVKKGKEKWDLQRFASNEPAQFIIPEFFQDGIGLIKQGRVNQILATMTTKGATPNKDHEVKVTKGDVTLTITEYDHLQAGLRISTQKLLDMAEIAFTKQSHTTTPDGNIANRTIHFPLEYYARLCNVDVTQHPKDTPEEIEAERKRAKMALDNFRRSVDKDLKVLQHLQISWKEKRRGAPADYRNINLIQETGIRNGYVDILLGERFALYLSKGYLSQYPQTLFRIPATNPNAWAIGRKLAAHHSIDGNVKRGTNNIIKVETLLEAAPEIPSYEEVKASNNRSWRRYIRDPLEKYLDTLEEYGVIKSWEYSIGKGKPLSDELLDPGKYREWAQLYVVFDMEEAPGQDERRERKAEKIAAAAEKARSKSPKKSGKKKKGSA